MIRKLFIVLAVFALCGSVSAQTVERKDGKVKVTANGRPDWLGVKIVGAGVTVSNDLVYITASGASATGNLVNTGELLSATGNLVTTGGLISGTANLVNTETVISTTGNLVTTGQLVTGTANLVNTERLLSATENLQTIIPWKTRTGTLAFSATESVTDSFDTSHNAPDYGIIRISASETMTTTFSADGVFYLYTDNTLTGSVAWVVGYGTVVSVDCSVAGTSGNNYIYVDDATDFTQEQAVWIYSATAGQDELHRISEIEGNKITLYDNLKYSHAINQNVAGVLEFGGMVMECADNRQYARWTFRAAQTVDVNYFVRFK